MGQMMVHMGAMLQCSFGMAPSNLIVLPLARTLAQSLPAADVTCSAPILNIPPFGMCQTLSNPMVAAATAAALGVLTPMPCIPVTTPWSPGAPTTLIGGKPALTMGSTCQCAWGGVIQIVNPGVTTAMAG